MILTYLNNNRPRRCNGAVFLIDNMISSCTLRLFYVLLVLKIPTIRSAQNLGDSCKINIDGSNGICKYARECPTASQFVAVGIKPDICSYDEEYIPIVCCPGGTPPRTSYTSSSTTTTEANDENVPYVYPTTKFPSQNNRLRISEQKCEEYGRPVTSVASAIPLVTRPEPVVAVSAKCEFSSHPLIVDGQAAEPAEFPHMAAVGFWSDGKVEWRCGGTLISEHFVMTAAHCTNDPPVSVRLGELNLFDDDDGAQPVEFAVENYIIHPQYVPSVFYYDIALLRLNDTVVFNQFVRPACLWTRNYIGTKLAVATGWGRVSYGGSTSPNLLKVTVPLIDNNQCSELYRSPDKNIPNGIMPTMMCAGNLSGYGDTCSGDSGGPLCITNRSNGCLYYVIGITSFGRNCAGMNSPGVYTRVSSFVSWIEQTIWT